MYDKKLLLEGKHLDYDLENLMSINAIYLVTFLHNIFIKANLRAKIYIIFGLTPFEGSLNHSLVKILDRTSKHKL